MALSLTPQAAPLAGTLIVETAASSTLNLNVTGTSGAWYILDINNSNATQDVYLKMYDDAAPTLGVTEPHWVIKIPAATRTTLNAPTGSAYATALSFACVTTAGLAGTTAPALPPTVRILVT